jgi:cation/acetate symporter
MAGIIAFRGYDGSVYLMGWTGGYVLLALLLAPYLRKFGKFTVPDFIGDRYYSQTARLVAVICAIFVSFTYVAGQMRGVGIVSPLPRGASRPRRLIGMAIVFFYAVLGGMKGITYTQVAQYCVLIFAYTMPAIFISLMLTGNPVPQLGLGGTLDRGPACRCSTARRVVHGARLRAYTDGTKKHARRVLHHHALMVGTAGLPHVIIRFFTVPKRARRAHLGRLGAGVHRAALHHAPAVAASRARTCSTRCRTSRTRGAGVVHVGADGLLRSTTTTATASCSSSDPSAAR